MAALDLLTIEEAREAIGLERGDTDSDLVLAGLLTALSLKVDDDFGPVVTRTITGEEHNGGRDHVILKHRPVSSITTLTEYDSTAAQVLTAETNSSKPEFAYKLDDGGSSGIVYRRSVNGRALFPEGLGNVVVTYVAGRFASTTAVSSMWKDAAAVALKARWSAEEISVALVEEYDAPSGRFPKFVIPNYVREMLSSAAQYQGPLG